MENFQVSNGKLKFWGKWVPNFWLGATGCAYFGLIIIYKKWAEQAHSASVAALIEHEKIHIEQQRKEPFKFYFKYIFSRKWRLEYELQAFVVQIQYLIKDSKKSVWRDVRIKELAENFSELLSSPMYLLFYSKNKIHKEFLKRLQGLNLIYKEVKK